MGPEAQRIHPQPESPGDEEKGRPSAVAFNIEPPISQTSLQPEGSDLAQRGSGDEKKGVKAAVAEKLGDLKDKMNLTGIWGTALLHLTLFVLINFIIILYFFLWPQWRRYIYYSARKTRGSLETRLYGSYRVAQRFTPATIVLDVNDLYDAPVPATGAYMDVTSRVCTPDDGSRSLCWALQDILGVDRVYDTDQRFTFNGHVYVQNYTACASNCLNTSGFPADLGSRSMSEYGSGGDYYLHPQTFMQDFDIDYYAAFVENGGQGNTLREHSGRYGQPGQGSLLDTAPTAEGYICNLGRRRRRTTSITVNTHGCSVQLASTQGSEWKLFIKQRYRSGLKGDIDVAVSKDEDTGCRSQELVITVYNPHCSQQRVPGDSHGCDNDCMLVLFKGENARHLPVVIRPTSHPDAPVGTLRVNDPFFHLESHYDEPDLTVTGGEMDVSLQHARIGNISVHLPAGTIHLEQLRYDMADLHHVAADVFLEDSRNTELRYRSASELLCLAAPVVEQMPNAFTQCNMDGAHEHYDTIPDGVIDRSEFLQGLQSMNLDFESDSLDLDEQQQEDLTDHVFSYTNPDRAVQALPYDLFQRQLETLMPPFTTLYDSNSKQTGSFCATDDLGLQNPNLEQLKAAWTSMFNSVVSCMASCALGNSSRYRACQSECVWHCQNGNIGITEGVYGLCEPAQGCTLSCGNADASLSSSNTGGAIDYHYYDVDPPDGVIDMQEMRQALLKLFGNCTYVIEPYESQYTTCVYDGGGQYQMGFAGEARRSCTRYSEADRLAAGLRPYDDNPLDWRYNNSGLPASSDPALLSRYSGTAPRECRPFPDYDPTLSGKQYDPSATPESCPECFLLSGERVPPHYYNRSTWASNNRNLVMSFLKQVFTEDVVKGGHFAYFNISDDDQWRTFASKMFTKTELFNTVPYDVFNANLQTSRRLDAIADNYYLLKPDCYRGFFLKTAPGDWSGTNLSAVQGNVLVRASASNMDLVLDSHMPGFSESTDSPSTLKPCPADWGNGTQHSTTFSYFYWASSQRGFKWGRALPQHCLDESWPGTYPGILDVYGSVAGQPVPPGCVPMACKPLLMADLGHGSLHAQVLPFEFDVRNSSGQYHSMVQKCVDQDGASMCFYKGYPSTMDYRLSRASAAELQDRSDETARASQKEDYLVQLVIEGHGVPEYKKWFWTSRGVYMQLEPAWLQVFSFGVLKPTLKRNDIILSPGLCDATYGAVEHSDFRDNVTYGYLPGDPTVDASLRLAREAEMYKVLYDAIRPSDERNLKGEFYLKHVWRSPYRDEQLQYSPVAADPASDTDAGFLDDDSGLLTNVGPQYRYERVCLDSSCSSYSVKKKNCMVPGADRVVGGAVQACTQYLDSHRGPESDTFNDTRYEGQFARSFDEYSWDEMRKMKGWDVLRRNDRAGASGYADANATSYNYDKLLVTQTPAGDVSFVVKKAAWKDNIALLLAIVLSILIAALMGFGAMSVLLYLGMKQLLKVNQRSRDRLLALEEKRKARWEALFESVSADYRKSRRDEARRLGEDPFSIPESELELPAEVRADVEAFATQEGWVPKSDVNAWDPGKMKLKWDKASARGTLPQRSEASFMMISCKQLNRSRGAAPVAEGTLAAIDEGTAETNTGTSAQKPKHGQVDTQRLLAAMEAKEKLDTLSKLGILRRSMWFVNEMRKRLMRMLIVLFGQSFPSPFEVVNVVLISNLRKRLINSLTTFIRIKCVQDQDFTPKLCLRLGGTLEDLEEYDDALDPDVRILRLGVGLDVGVSRTIFGKVIRYQCEWVEATVEEQEVFVEGRSVGMVPVVCIREGPRVFTNQSMVLKDWEKHIQPAIPAKGEKRAFQLPHQFTVYGGTDIFYVVKGTWGTRTICIDTCPHPEARGDGRTSLVPTITFKTVLRNFNPQFEQFCMDHDLEPVDVLKSQSALAQLGIRVSKRIVARLKGVRPKTAEDRVLDIHRQRYLDSLKEAGMKDGSHSHKVGQLTVSIPVDVTVSGPGHVAAINLKPQLLLENETGSIASAMLAAMPRQKQDGGAVPKQDATGSSGEGSGATQARRKALEPENTAIRDGASKSIQEALDQQAKQAINLSPGLGIYQSGATGVLQPNPPTDGDEDMMLKNAQAVERAMVRALSQERRGVPQPSISEGCPAAESAVEQEKAANALQQILDRSDDDEKEASIVERELERQLERPPTLLETSEEQLAQFIRSQYSVTGRMAHDLEEFEVFNARYRAWCQRNDLDPEDLDPDEFAKYGMVYTSEAFYDMFGITVNERDLSVDPQASNLHIYYILQLVTVICHTLLIWVLCYPLLHMVMWQQSYYEATTAIQPQLTVDVVQEYPYDIFSGKYNIFPVNQFILAFCFIWLIFAHIRLLIFYSAPGRPGNSTVETVTKTIFWIFVLFLVSVIVSYILLACTWLVLGAVIAPEKFLPYCTAVITLFAHCKATTERLKDLYNNVYTKISLVVTAAFVAKIAAAKAVNNAAQGSKEKAKDENMDAYAIFALYSGDDEKMSYEEFVTALDRFDVDMIEDKRRLLYIQSDVDGDNSITYIEFEKAWKKIQNQLVADMMQEQGITKARLAAVFVYSVVVLLMVFAFIFVGVAAFLGSGAFGAVVSSTLTAGAGLALNTGKSNPEKKESEDPEEQV